MKLYSKADRDAELEVIEMASQMLSARVASGQISGLKCLEIERKLEYEKRRVKGKFLRSQDIVADIKRAKRNVQDGRVPATASDGSEMSPEQMLGRAFGRVRFNQSPNSEVGNEEDS